MFDYLFISRGSPNNVYQDLLKNVIKNPNVIEQVNYIRFCFRKKSITLKFNWMFKYMHKI